MRTKILAVIAVLAMMFAGVAYLADEADAAATGQITVGTELYVDRTIQVTYTLTGVDVPKGVTVTWSVVKASDGTSSSTAATIEGTKTTTTSVTDVFGKAYATLTGVTGGESVKITATLTGDYASATVTSSTATDIKALGENQIGSWTVAEASNFATDKSSRMYIFQYTDETLMIDTKYMTNVDKVSLVHVGLYQGADAPAADSDYNLVSAIGINDKLFVDLKGNFANNETTWVKLFNYDSMTPLSKEIGITVKTAAASKLALNAQYNNDIEGNHASAPAVTYSNLVRNETFVLDDSRSTDLLRAGFKLVGWSYDVTKVDGLKNGNGNKDVPMTALPIEEILMLNAQAFPDNAGALPTVQVSDVTTLYGVWDKLFYTITYIDPNETTPDFDGSTTYAVNADDGNTLTATPVASISGSTVIGGEETSFGIISIVKKDASRDTDYVYKLKIMNEAGALIDGGDYNYASKLTTSACLIEMVNNGTWKIHHVSQNLKISVIAVKTTELETGVDFGVNYVMNDFDSGKNGEARLNLTLNDYPNVGGQQVYMKGTYFRVLSDLEGVRVYGNIENLTVLGDGATAIGGDFERTYTAYIDRVSETATYVNESDGSSAAATKIPGKAGEGIVRAGNLDNGILYTTIGPEGYEYEGGHVYDLVLKTKAGTSAGIYLYGIQGVWDTDGSETAGEVYYTPWAIYEDNSDGQGKH